MRNYMNLFVFAVHYGNVRSHLTHLFYPWKRTVVTTGPWYEKLIGTLFAMTLGFVMRSFVLVSTFVFLVFLVLFFPIFALFWLLFLPLRLMWRVLFPYAKKKETSKRRFIAAHASSDQEIETVSDWFEEAWESRLQERASFSLTNLLSVTPVGNDWNYGFTPTLNLYSHPVQAISSRDCIARKDVVTELFQKLAKTSEANVLLVGEPGVGKQTLLRYCSTLMYSGSAPTVLQHFRMIEVEMQKIWTEKHSFADQYAFLETLFHETVEAGNCILVIPDFERYVSSEFDGDFSALWERYEALPGVKIIGVTTPRMVEKYMSHHEKIMSLFNKVLVSPMSMDEAKAMLLRIVPVLEFGSKIVVPLQTIQHILVRSDIFMTVIPFPEKAIVLLNESIETAKKVDAQSVKKEHVDTALSKLIKGPVGVIPTEIAGSVQEIYPQLATRIYGQEAALHEISGVIQRGFMKEPTKKPRVTLLFLGPTGVGKTETAKVVAAAITGDERNMIRFDMSFYQTQDAIHDFMKLFAEGVRKNPFGVLLIDEIEKTQRSIMNLFLTLLDEGYMIDIEGAKVDCRNLLVIATSNANEKKLFEIFSPEFLNRFDRVVTFEAITPEIAFFIAKKMCEQKKISITDEQLRTAISTSFDPRFGARDVIRMIESLPIG